MSEQPPDSFAGRLRVARERHEMTREDVAEALHVSIETVRKWETGTAWPQPQFIPALERLLNVSP